MFLLLITLIQTPPNNTMFQILRENSNLWGPRFYDRMQAIQQDQYNRSLEDRLNNHERILQELRDDQIRR